mmetsp:Transcript_95166/g.183506  ORF Transcript_95166/g.183506 Transcript_95166/m.183506 type:complete len:211 (-) Transcript_95166:467-1099(-)
MQHLFIVVQVASAVLELLLHKPQMVLLCLCQGFLLCALALDFFTLPLNLGFLGCNFRKFRCSLCLALSSIVLHLHALCLQCCLLLLKLLGMGKTLLLCFGRSLELLLACTRKFLLFLLSFLLHRCQFVSSSLLLLEPPPLLHFPGFMELAQFLFLACQLLPHALHLLLLSLCFGLMFGLLLIELLLFSRKRCLFGLGLKSSELNLGLLHL